MAKRKNFSKMTIAERLKFCGGRCEKCGVVLKVGAFHCDHDIPDGLTGEPTFDNARILCLDCHGAKTKIDVAKIAKAKRQEARHLGITKPKGQIKSPGFAKKERRERIGLPPRRPMFIDIDQEKTK